VVPLPAPWAAAFRDATGHRIVEGYGLTEAGPVVTSTPIDGTAAAGSAGRPLPGIELRLVDRDGRPVGRTAAAADRAPGVAEVRAAASRAASEVRAAAGRGVAEVRAAAGRAATEVRAAVRAAQPAGDPVGDMIDDAQDVEGPADPTQDTGLIALRGPNLFSGYWPDRTGGPDADGWFRTPDIGFLDPAGDLHLVDRSTDLVVVSGFTVYPHEIERVLLEMPAVVEAAVVGVPDEKTGQAVRAVVVRAGGPDPTQPDAAAVRAHCSARLARFKVPAQVVFVDALPRTPSGKLARKELAGGGGAGGDR
jgi:long-chain acyl-CoA synthetase